MKIHEMKVENVRVDQLIQHPENANNSDLEALEESISVNGFYSPILVQRSTNYIIAGNHRWLVALKREAEFIPVIFLDVDEIEAKRIMLSDNRITRLGRDDEALIYELLQDIAAASPTLEGTGYTAEDFMELEAINRDPLEFEVEPELPPLAEDTTIEIMPVEGEDGRCYEFTVIRADGAWLTPGDLNKLRRGIGMHLMDRREMEKYGIDTWNRRF